MSEPTPPNDEPTPDLSSSGWTLAGIGIAAGLIPLFVHVSSSSSAYVNGRLVASSYRDYVAVACGGIAVLFGALAIVQARRALASVRMQRFLVAAAAIVLGGYQIARGLGVFAPHADAPDEGPAVATIEPHLPGDASTAPAVPPPICADPEACNELGGSLEKSDPARSLAAYLQGCGPEGRGNCFNAALALRDGTPGDPVKALALFEQACTYKMPLACSNLGAMLKSDRKGVTRDDARAQKLYEQACADDDGLGCANLGKVFKKTDPPKSVELFRKACKLESAFGCVDLGIALYAGDGVPKDSKAAFAAFEAACAVKDEPQCYDLAIEYVDGKDVKQDLAKARALYTTACDGTPDACNNLGVMMRDGQGGPKDPEHALQRFAEACDRGVELGCTNRDKLAPKLK